MSSRHLESVASAEDLLNDSAIVLIETEERGFARE